MLTVIRIATCVIAYTFTSLSLNIQDQQPASLWVTVIPNHRYQVLGLSKITAESGKEIRLYNTLYVLSLNVSLLSIKKHKKVVGCYYLSGNNKCVVAFPSFLIKVDNKDELEFNVHIPTTPPTTRPNFDESSAETYTTEGYILLFNRPSHPDLQNVTIILTLKTKLVKYSPSRLTQQSIGYALKAITLTSIGSNYRKSIPLRLSIFLWLHYLL